MTDVPGSFCEDCGYWDRVEWVGCVTSARVGLNQETAASANQFAEKLVDGSAAHSAALAGND